MQFRQVWTAEMLGGDENAQGDCRRDASWQLTAGKDVVRESCRWWDLYHKPGSAPSQCGAAHLGGPRVIFGPLQSL